MFIFDCEAGYQPDNGQNDVTDGSVENLSLIHICQGLKMTLRKFDNLPLISNKIVQENHLTTLMITHNMRDAIRYGNRLIMLNEGHVIYDVRGEEKTKLEVSALLQRFEQAGGRCV